VACSCVRCCVSDTSWPTIARRDVFYSTNLVSSTRLPPLGAVGCAPASSAPRRPLPADLFADRRRAALMTAGRQCRAGSTWIEWQFASFCSSDEWAMLCARVGPGEGCCAPSLVHPLCHLTRSRSATLPVWWLGACTQAADCIKWRRGMATTPRRTRTVPKQPPQAHGSAFATSSNCHCVLQTARDERGTSAAPAACTARPRRLLC
jgi:hypothetical protein